MSGLLAFVAARRKALGYIVAALAEYVTTLLPQANAQNSQVLHSIVLALGFLLVYLPENVKAAAAEPDVQQFIDQLAKGDSPNKHEAPAPPPPLPGPPTQPFPAPPTA